MGIRPPILVDSTISYLKDIKRISVLQGGEYVKGLNWYYGMQIVIVSPRFSPRTCAALPWLIEISSRLKLPIIAKTSPISDSA